MRIRTRLIACGMLFVALGLSRTAAGSEENAAQALSRTSPSSRDLSKEENKALYCVGYAHLDTQWRWDFATTIDRYILATLDDNFARLEKYPDYVFSFTGSVRYEMMKEYYPEKYERLKQYIADGRWFVSGSSVDEGDVNVPSPESVIRQVLYGNLLFKREFGKESVDFMLPDCFGFPASMPSIWAHCGLIGFSTQKLTWGSAVGIPFPVGVWEGPNGEGVIAALDPGSYASGVQGRVDRNDHWQKRVDQNGRLYGVWADYHYYGVGDQGGAPREKDVANYTSSAAAEDEQMDVLLVSSDQLYRDITTEQRARLPRYRGDMLLTEHSAGTLTSQSYMKRWNRKGEQLADAAERAATAGWLLGTTNYPRHKLERAWVRLLANQMHDILPGTSIPRAYRYSWNDDVVAINQFAHVLTDSVGDVSAMLDTRAEGTPLVVFNPLSVDRTDTVEATLTGGDTPAVRVFGPYGKEVPSQAISRQNGEMTLLFVAAVPANGYAVFDVRSAAKPFDDGKGPSVSDKLLENETYRVVFNDAGDVEQIVDKKNDKQMLSRPTSLVFTHERPRHYPAWNMDWADRRNPPIGTVDGKPQWRIIESGPVRVALEVTREARNSIFTQVYRLTRDDPGQVVEVAATIDWQSTECALKASFPLSTANPEATYNWGLGTISRGNNEPVKYEVPSHEWFDLTEPGGEYGVSVIEDSKFGSDKPSDEEVRLTLLYTPGVRGSFMDQHSQDWGVHNISYGLYGHEGDWRTAKSEWRGRRFNQPLKAFAVGKHAGPLGKEYSLVRTSTPQIDIRAIKLAEQRDAMIVRVQELWGKPASQVALVLPAPIKHAEEVDGQERTLAHVVPMDNELVFDLEQYGLKTFAIELMRPDKNDFNVKQAIPVAIPFDTDVVTRDSDRSDGAMDGEGRSYPGEMLPDSLVDDNVLFRLGGTSAGESQAATCRGQEIGLKTTKGNEIHILAAATDDAEAIFRVGDQPYSLGVQSWTGFIGQWYDRVWDVEFEEVDFKCDGKVVAILPGLIKRDPIAWFATHRHHPKNGNEAYKFSYLYHYVLPRPDDKTQTLTLPFDERIRIFAVSVAYGSLATPIAPLYDDLSGAKPIKIRHDYNEIQDRIFSGLEPVAKVKSDRESSFDQLSIGPPRSNDSISSLAGETFEFVDFAINGSSALHGSSGAVDGRLIRLNDGEVARNDDDTSRCIWYDGPGRFTIDLHALHNLSAVNTYSWHRSNRAPQFFSLWGSNKPAMPNAGFSRDNRGEWDLIAVVDTRKAGDGEIHGTRIHNPDGVLGPYRHLLWICEDQSQGTFLTEIDVDFAE